MDRDSWLDDIENLAFKSELQKLADSPMYPEEKHVLSDYGFVYYKMRNYEKALDLFERAHLIYPKVKYYRRLSQLARKKIEQEA